MERGTSVDALFFLEAQNRTIEAYIYYLYLQNGAIVVFFIKSMYLIFNYMYKE